MDDRKQQSSNSSSGKQSSCVSFSNYKNINCATMHNNVQQSRNNQHHFQYHQSSHSQTIHLDLRTQPFKHLE